MLLSLTTAKPMTDLRAQTASIPIQAGSGLLLSGSINLLRLDNECTGSKYTVTNMKLMQLQLLFFFHVPTRSHEQIPGRQQIRR